MVSLKIPRSRSSSAPRLELKTTRPRPIWHVVYAGHGGLALRRPKSHKNSPLYVMDGGPRNHGAYGQGDVEDGDRQSEKKKKKKKTTARKRKRRPRLAGTCYTCLPSSRQIKRYDMTASNSAYPPTRSLEAPHRGQIARSRRPLRSNLRYDYQPLYRLSRKRRRETSVSYGPRFAIKDQSCASLLEVTAIRRAYGTCRPRGPCNHMSSH